MNNDIEGYATAANFLSLHIIHALFGSYFFDQKICHKILFKYQYSRPCYYCNKSTFLKKISVNGDATKQGLKFEIQFFSLIFQGQWHCDWSDMLAMGCRISPDYSLYNNSHHQG